MTVAIDRRGLLRATGALVVAFALPAATARAQATGAPAGPGNLTAFIELRPDGHVVLWSPTVEMGQGTQTARASTRRPRSTAPRASRWTSSCRGWSTPMRS